MSRRLAAGVLGCLLLAAGASAADRKPAYDPSLWSGTAGSPRTGGTLSQDLAAPAPLLPGTLSGSATPSPTHATPPPPAPEPPPASANPSLDPWREPRAGMGQRPWGEIPQRFQSDSKAAGGERRRDPPVIIIAPPGGYMPGQLPGSNALSFPFGYTPGGYGANEWLTPGLGYGSGYPGSGGIWPGGMGGWPGGLGGLPFNAMPFAWD